MGVTLSFIFIAYDLGTITAAFVSAAGMFGAAAVYGAVTKRSLASMGGYLFMGLIGLVIALGDQPVPPQRRAGLRHLVPRGRRSSWA